MGRTSGIQKEVLALYRRALRMVSTKPPSAQPKFLLFVRYTFRMHANSVGKRDMAAIEHIMRKGTRTLEIYESPDVKDCWVSQQMRDWEKEQGIRRFPLRESS